MAGKFGEITEFWNPGLTMTVLSKDYVVPLPGPMLGLWCEMIADRAPQLRFASTPEEISAALDKLDELPELEGNLVLAQRVLGSVHAELVADDVPHHFIKACADTAFVWIVLNEDKAREFYESGGRPESVARGNRASRRASSKTSTGAANGAPSPASTTGTTSRKKSRRNGKRSGQGRQSRGATS